MKVFFSAQQMHHEPKEILVSGAPQPNPEVPERATRLLRAATELGLSPSETKDYGEKPINEIHPDRYLTFLKNIYTRWQRIPGASTDAIPNIHPDGRNVGYPASAVGQLGYHVFDGACPINEHTWNSVYWSAQSAVNAAHDVLNGASASYALARPPGHHAEADLVGGFCYLNNSAIAAQVLRSRYQRVAIIDIDVHHGNGTQQIFYRRDDVYTLSLHADPVRFYPFFWGYAQETGDGPGKHHNQNVPLPRGTTDSEYLENLKSALEPVSQFDPDALVIALGLDASIDDPFQGLKITPQGFEDIAIVLSAFNKPTVLVQEGGYLSPNLGLNLQSALGPYL